MSRFVSLFCVLSLFVAVAASAQEAPAANGLTPVVDRGIVLPKGTGEVGLDLNVGLTKGVEAKRFFVESQNPAERYSGLSFKYGLIDNLELGLATQLGYQDPDFKWGGAKIYGKYGFLPFLGAELGILLPGEKFGDYRLSLDVGIPFKYAILPGMLAIHARPDLVIGFADKNTVGGGKAVQLSIVSEVGVTFNATEALYFDVSAGFNKALSPSANLQVPLGIMAGYTVIKQLDLYLTFQFLDLALSGAAIDQRSIGLGGRFRF
ncbi:MAG: hypothetical protein FJ087_20475 [Deltaproteobacteria bacterium]|nr:hypothetical protein [Deltaproteobacteria bacterium]